MRKRLVEVSFVDFNLDILGRIRHLLDLSGAKVDKRITEATCKVGREGLLDDVLGFIEHVDELRLGSLVVGVHIESLGGEALGQAQDAIG